MSTCPFFPKYCTSVRHNIEATCFANMRSYYGRARSFGCPTCFEVVDTSFEDFLAVHKSHLGQYRDASKIDIIRRIVTMPQIKLAPLPLTIVPPPLIIVPQEVSPPNVPPPNVPPPNVPPPNVPPPNVPPPNVCKQRDWESTSSYVPPPFNSDIDEREYLEKEQQQHFQKKQQEKSPSFDSTRHEENQIEMLKESLSVMNENVVKFVRRSRKEKAELISYLTEETKEKANLQVKMEELRKENMEIKEAMLSLINSIKEKEEEKNKRRKEKEEEKKKRRNEKEEEKKKRRKEKEEEAMDRDVEIQFKETQMDAKIKGIVIESIDEWNTRQGERKRQQKRDEEDSQKFAEKKRKH